MTHANLNPDLQRQHNQRNTLHTVLLIAGTTLLMGIMAYSVLDVAGLVIAAVFGAAGVVTLSRVSPQMILGLYKARALTPDELPELHDIMRQLAKRADLPAVPQLYYVPSKMLNAFAVGRRDDAAIAVTAGLVRAMNLRQITGILGHETAHIANGDLKIMGLADVLNRITSFMSTVGLIGLPIVFGTGLDIPLLGLALMIFAPMIGGLMQLGLSRAREYDADLDGVALTGDPEGLASALQALEDRQQGLWEGMVLPGGRSPHPSILRTHPKTQDRIARLRVVSKMPREQISAGAGRSRSSLVRRVAEPRVHWLKLGIYY